MRFAYADPPYPGQAKKHYAHDPLCAEVDHKLLVSWLCADFSDGWALSTSSTALRRVLAVCPEDVRVGAWVKPFASFKPGVNPAYCWEPVIFGGGRRLGRDVPTVRDFVSEVVTIKKGLAGAKPIKVCFWIFEMLGALPGDELVDLFPGTGVVTDAWYRYISNKQHVFRGDPNLPLFPVEDLEAEAEGDILASLCEVPR